MFNSRCLVAFNIMKKDYNILVDYRIFQKTWTEISSIDGESFPDYPVEVQAYLMAFYFEMLFDLIKFKKK